MALMTEISSPEVYVRHVRDVDPLCIPIVEHVLRLGVRSFAIASQATDQPTNERTENSYNIHLFCGLTGFESYGSPVYGTLM